MDKSNIFKFEYPALELIQSDETLSKKFGKELTKDPLNIDRLVDILKSTEKMDSTMATGKVKHAIENQLPSTQEVLREIAVQNTIDAYFELENLLAKRNEKIQYPLKVDITCVKTGEDKFNIEIRDYAIGMTLFDVLHKYLAVGDTSKQDRAYLVGGHGRGAKPGIYYSDKVSIESFRKKTEITKEGGKYFVSIGPDSNVDEGTKITLENITLKEDPLLVIKKFAGSITEQFDFRINNLKINAEGDNKEIGKLTWEETREIKTTGLELSDKLTASSKQAEGIEVTQSVMSLFKNPISVDNVRRIIKIPTNYLLSRSRNEIPEPVQDVLEDKGDKVYKKFFNYLYENLFKIGAFEFQFMDSFSKRKGRLTKIASGSYKLMKRSALAFLIGASLFVLVDKGVRPVCDEIMYHVSSNNFSMSKYIPSTHRPIADIQEYIVRLFGDSRLFRRIINSIERIKKNPFGEYRVYELTKDGYGISYFEDVFFKIQSYNTLLKDGSWTNRAFNLSDNLLTISSKKGPFINVLLNLNAYKKLSFLPTPISNSIFSISGPSFDRFEGPISDFPNLAYDAQIIIMYSKPKTEFPLRYGVEKIQEIILSFESDTEIKKDFIKIPFKIIYPKDLEEKIEELEKYALNEEEKSRMVTKIVRDYLTYNTSVNNHLKYMNMDNVINDPLKTKNVDCDVANGILAAILRDKYEIPTRLSIGLQGKEGKLTLDSGHGVCEAYIKQKGWVELDATPVKMNQEMIKAEEASWFLKALLWFKNLLPSWEINPAETKVVNTYSNFKPDSGLISKIFRKVEYCISTASNAVYKNKNYILMGLGAGLLFSFVYGRLKKEETYLKNIPIVDTWVKDEENTYEEKININQGIEYMKQGELLYDKEIIKKGLEALAADKSKIGRYVVDYPFYTTILEMSGSKNRRISYSKKEGDDEETEIKPEILECITFEDKKAKEKNPEKKIETYANTISTLQKITTDICKANRIKEVYISGAYKFEDKEKMFSFKSSVFKPRIYVNLDNPSLNKDTDTLYRNETLIDSLTFTIALTKNLNIGEINEMKRNYLNKVVLKDD